MVGVTAVKDEVASEIAAVRGLLGDVARALYERPEIGGEESFAADLLTRSLEEAGFTVRLGVAGLPTAFVGTVGADAVARQRRGHAPRWHRL